MSCASSLISFLKSLFFLLLASLLLVLPSCKGKKDPVADQTLLIYMPWSGNLTSYFKMNLNDIMEALEGDILDNERVLVCFANDTEHTALYEMYYSKGEVFKRAVSDYYGFDFTNDSTIAAMLKDVKAHAPARKYTMIVSGHGMGWIPVEGVTDAQPSQRTQSAQTLHYQVVGDAVPVTRYFGGLTAEYQTDITTFAEAIRQAGMHFEYIAFDDCYMASIEVAYDLRQVTDHLIACPTEIMAYGFPYKAMLPYLLGEVNYKAITDEFLKFYEEYSEPYGTLGVVDCRELTAIASLVKRVNQQFSSEALLNDARIQKMDGYTPSIFYDLGSYVQYLCADSTLYAEFQQQLERLVPYKVATEYYPTNENNRFRTLRIHTYSGITTSDPSINNLSVETKCHTQWYKATH